MHDRPIDVAINHLSSFAEWPDDLFVQPFGTPVRSEVEGLGARHARIHPTGRGTASAPTLVGSGAFTPDHKRLKIMPDAVERHQSSARW
jgi:hypothetical protein